MLAVKLKPMSIERQLRRRNQIVFQKPKKEIDWTKIRKIINNILLVCLVFSAIVFAFSYYTVKTQNSIRRTVSENATFGEAKVISISSGKGVHAATYEFEKEGRKYQGTSFNSYKGEVGDDVCIQYASRKPEISLLCDEVELDNLFDNSFLFTLKIFGIAIIFTTLLLVWKVITQDKKVIAELTSRKHKYR
jgi:small-conductance mechanosensitive channel